MKIRFPIGTAKAAEIIGCSVEAIKKHCVGHVKRLNGNSGPYLIFACDLEYLKKDIRDRPGRVWPEKN